MSAHPKDAPLAKSPPDTEKRRGYFGEIVRAIRTIGEGMAITFAELTRSRNNQTTVQYPDRTAVPVSEALPERYRGFLEVDLDTCTGCKACERDCPIDVIKIDLEKDETGRYMTRFDIDMGKCMYCNICVESCPVEVQAEGDAELSKSIRMTREFEAATGAFDSLTFRFIPAGERVPTFKPKKGEVPGSPRRGGIARAVRRRASEENPAACDEVRRLQAHQDDAEPDTPPSEAATPHDASGGSR